jgi:hypothetical protein
MPRLDLPEIPARRSGDSRSDHQEVRRLLIVGRRSVLP